MVYIYICIYLHVYVVHINMYIYAVFSLFIYFRLSLGGCRLLDPRLILCWGAAGTPRKSGPRTPSHENQCYILAKGQPHQ